MNLLDKYKEMLGAGLQTITGIASNPQKAVNNATNLTTGLAKVGLSQMFNQAPQFQPFKPIIQSAVTGGIRSLPNLASIGQPGGYLSASAQNIGKSLGQNPVGATKGFYRGVRETVEPLGYSFGTAVRSPFEQSQIAQQKITAQATSQRLYDQALQARRQGNSALAKRLTQQAQDQMLNVASRQRNLGTDEARYSKGQIGASAVKTGLSALAGSAGANLLPTTAIGGTMSAGMASLSGQDPSEAFGYGVAQSLPWATVNKISEGVVGSSLGAANKFAPTYMNMLAKGATGVKMIPIKGALYATGNVIEDEIFTRLMEGRSLTNNERAISFGAGLGFGAGSEVLKQLKNVNVDQLAKELGISSKQAQQAVSRVKTRVIKSKPEAGFAIEFPDGGAIYGFKKDAELSGWLRHLQDSNKEFNVRYIDTPEVKEMMKTWGKAPGAIDFSAKVGSKTIGQMQASVEQPLKQAFVKAQNSGNITAMEKVVKQMELDPAYSSVASVHRTMLERIKKNSPDLLLARLNKAQESGDYLRATQLTDQIRGNRGSFMSAKAPGFADFSAKVGGEATSPKGKIRVTKTQKANLTNKPIQVSTVEKVQNTKPTPKQSYVPDNVKTQTTTLENMPKQPGKEVQSSTGILPQQGFAESVGTNKKTPKELKADLEALTYSPLSNKKTLDSANKIIKQDEAKALDYARNGEDTQSNAVALRLIEKYIDEGRYSEANDLVTAVSPKFTKLGQQIQVLSAYGRLTPTGAVRYAQNLINKANKANPRLKLQLTDENTKIIAEYAKKVQSMPVNSRERAVATAQLMQKITDQVPASIGQKISTIQTMSQLLNIKTAVRNTLGNTIFTGAENVSDVVASGLDRVVSLITGKRSKAMPSLIAQGKGFVRGLKEGAEDARLGIDTSSSGTQFDLNPKTFSDPILGTLEKALNYELRVPDRAAYTAAFEGSLNNQMKIAKVKVPTPDMIEIAHQDGLYRTFQDNSKLAQIFSGAKKVMNKAGTPDGKFGVGDFLLKYPKTPANIISRGIDYSPLAFIKGLLEATRPLSSGQPFNQRKFVETMSRAMVGTGLISAGYVLAQNGIITGKSEKDYDISSVQRTTGQGAFKFNVDALRRYVASGGKKQDAQNGDLLISYDWAQPISIQIAMGANMAKGGDIATGTASVADSMQAGVDTITGQPMVKNLMDYATSIKNKGLVSASTDMGLNSLTGFVPTTVKQVSDVFDPLQRSTYNPDPVKESLNKVQNRVPILRNSLEPKIDVFGKEMPNYEGSGIARMFDIFVNPSFVSRVKENPGAKEVLDIYQRSGETQQAPRVAQETVQINGQSVRVSPEQYTAYQKYIGSKTDTIFNSLINDPQFMSASDEDKAKLMANILTDVNSAAKIELFGNEPKTQSGLVKKIIKLTPEQGDTSSFGSVGLTKEGNLKITGGAIEKPELTGNSLVDTKLISKYNSEISAQQSDLIELQKAGAITKEQLVEQVNMLETKKIKRVKAKKPKKVTFKVPKISTIKVKPIKTKKISLKTSKKRRKIKVYKLTA